jgi:hypothetical protein
MKRKLIVATVAVLAVGGAALAQAKSDPFKELRQATARYHSLEQVQAAGFVPFTLDPAAEEITCFDSAAGGMGVHYVRNIDDTIEALDPEAMVYEVASNGKYKLVAVEYIIPQDFVPDPLNPPVVWGQKLAKHSFLPVYVLHVWLWKDNPSGVFMDFNPDVSACA